jgi:hypothetical protein
MIPRTLFLAGLFLCSSLTAAGQTDKKAAEMKNLEVGIANAKARVAMNEKKLAEADSLINAGKNMILESKAEARNVDSDSRKLEKDYASQYHSLRNLSNSRDKTTANKAKTDSRALDKEYKASNRALETRLRDATKKQTTGITYIQKGKTARKNATEAITVANKTLKILQKKYNTAIGTNKDKSENNE